MRYLPVWLLLCSTALATDKLPVMVYPAPRAEKAPVLDGKFDDACWKAPPLVSGFTFFGKAKKVAEVQTSFRVTYDDRALYVALSCEEPLAAKLKKSGAGTHDDFHAFREECIELFVDPMHSHAHYYQIAMSLNETVYDGVGTDTTWNSHTRVKTILGAKGWTLEAAVPWADVGVKKASPGMLVGFNLCRDRTVENAREWTNWSPMAVGFHNAPLFGHVVLSPTTRMLGGMSAQLRKGDRQGPLRVFSSAGFTGAAYVELGRGALDELERVLGQLEAIAAKEPAAVAKGLRDHVAKVRADVAPTRKRLASGEKLNAADWFRIDRQVTQLRAQAAKALWDIRLKTLLDSI